MGTDDGTAGELQRVVERAGAGVVRIGRGWGRGAGFVVGADRVVTNAHNIRGGEVTVGFAGGRTQIGRVLGVDAEGDLAVVEVDTAGAAGLDWAPEGTVALGAPVVALTQDAVAGTRVTTGRVSALGAAFRSPQGRLVRDAVEHTAPLAKGSSGGPLLDVEGRVVGVNTHRRGEGFYLAIPADTSLRQRLDALATGARARRVELGLAVAPAEVANRLRGAVGLEAVEGLLVRGIKKGGAADRAGLRRGDLLTAAGGRALRVSDDLYEVLDGLAPGDDLAVDVVRGAEALEVLVVFDDPAGDGDDDEQEEGGGDSGAAT